MRTVCVCERVRKRPLPPQRWWWCSFWQEIWVSASPTHTAVWSQPQPLGQSRSASAALNRRNTQEHSCHVLFSYILIGYRDIKARFMLWHSLLLFAQCEVFIFVRTVHVSSRRCYCMKTLRFTDFTRKRVLCFTEGKLTENNMEKTLFSNKFTGTLTWFIID